MVKQVYPSDRRETETPRAQDIEHADEIFAQAACGLAGQWTQAHQKSREL